jgi:hypothetical protein
MTDSTANMKGYVMLAKAIVGQALKDYQLGKRIVDGDRKPHRGYEGEILMDEVRDWIENETGLFKFLCWACDTSWCFQKNALLRMLDFIDNGGEIKISFWGDVINYLIRTSDGKVHKGKL